MECQNCGNPKIENRDLMLCATCNKLRRKIDSAKAAEPKKPIKKVSEVRQKELQVYAKIRDKILMNNWCAYHGRPCIPTEIHHIKGRQNEMLYDEKYMLPVCSEAHRYIELHPNEAKEKGFSESRLI